MWQVISNGSPVGLYAEPDLVRWSFEGRVNPQDLLWRPGMSAAMPAHLVLPFAAAFDGRPPASMAPMGSAADDRAMRWILPVGRSGWAIAAGYLGLFSILVLPAPFALICGVLGINDIQKHQSRHGMGRAVFGVVAGSLGTLALLGIIAAQLHS